MSNTNINYLHEHKINEQYIMYIQWMVMHIHKWWQVSTLSILTGLITHLIVLRPRLNARRLYYNMEMRYANTRMGRDMYMWLHPCWLNIYTVGYAHKID